MWKEENIVAAIENNLYSLWIKAAQVSGNTMVIRKDMCWVSAYNSDWPNGVFRAKLDEHKIVDSLLAITKQIKAGSMPRFWTTGPQSVPVNLSEYLINQGFVNYYNQMGMAIDLMNIPTCTICSTDLEIKTISDVEMIRGWSEVAGKNFNEAINVNIWRKLLQEDDVEFLAGFIKGKIAATLLSFYSHGVAGIHFVSNLPEYRKTGVGTRITLAALHRAVNRGYRVGVLQASPMGVGIYRSLGFKEYFKLEHYRYDHLLDNNGHINSKG